MPKTTAKRTYQYQAPLAHVQDGMWWEVRLWDAQDGQPLTDAELDRLAQWVGDSVEYAQVKTEAP
jgi:hypothetical protein